MAHDIGAELAIGLAATAPLLAAADPAALDLLPVYAGLSGAIVAGLRLQGAQARAGDVSVGRWGWASMIVTGALASFWVGPAAVELFGATRTGFALLIHFATGLLGCTLCDLTLQNRDALARLFLRRVAKTDGKEGDGK